MPLTVFALKTCDTCKKAIRALEAAGRALKVVDVRADGVAPPILKGWIDEHGPDALVNRRSTTWRGLREDEQAKAATADGALELLIAHPTLMKRPVIVVSGGDGGSDVAVHVGWSKDVEAALL